MSERKQCLGEDDWLPFPNPCKVRVAENSPPDRAPQHRRVIGESGIRNHAATQKGSHRIAVGGDDMQAAVVPAVCSSRQVKDVRQPQPGPNQVLHSYPFGKCVSINSDIFAR